MRQAKLAHQIIVFTGPRNQFPVHPVQGLDPVTIRDQVIRLTRGDGNTHALVLRNNDDRLWINIDEVQAIRQTQHGFLLHA